ncbi:MAG TPA: endonuclease Q family protein [Candidatus Saccharimonadales bacterium]|nr:endonuclease Q family protein [Candidatus Saccharimonadales bacterium]
MKQVLDLHIHSAYSRACSPQLTLTNIEKTCREKGIDIIATGDFTYPAWFKSIREELEETFEGSGLYKLKTAPDDKIKFILATEVALIYKDETKVRRIHLVIHAPNIEAVAKLNKCLGAKYNIKSDGRPILGIKAPELVSLLLEIDSRFLIYPAHIWTPWFAVFGSKSGFDTLEDCFKEETKNIYAFETGLSSDPEMNWRLSALDNLTLLSSSDAHSPINIGREATVMELTEPISYNQIYEVIKHHKKGGQSGILYTIEFYPEEGMYHLDGHRDCNFSCSPEESKKLNNLCPVCQKPLVIGVLNRVAELADRPVGFKPKNITPFKKVIELDKIIAEVLNIKSRSAKRVQAEYQRLIGKFGNELFILLDCDLKSLEAETDSRIVAGLKKMRSGHLEIQPGFDGQYGKITIFSKNKKYD